MKVSFNELFTVQGGMIYPKNTVQIGGVTMNPGVGSSASGGVSFSGVDLSQYIGKDFDAENQNGVWVIKGVYN